MAKFGLFNFFGPGNPDYYEMIGRQFIVEKVYLFIFNKTQDHIILCIRIFMYPCADA